MDLNVLNSFAAIVEEGGMTRAADALHISQSAMSSSISKLEKELGVTLFVRGGKGLQLTREGEFFLAWARRLNTALAEGEQLLQDALTTSGHIRIGNWVENDGLYYLVSDFCKKYPQIQVHLYDEKEAWSDYRSSRLDFFVVPASETQGLPYIRLARRRTLYALMGSGHRLAGKAILRLEDLTEERFIFTATETGKMDPLYYYCKEQNFTPQVAFLCEGTKSMLDLITQTGTVTLAYNTFRQFRQSMNGIVAVPLDCDLGEPEEIVLAWKEELSSPLAEVFLEAAKEYLEDYWRERPVGRGF